MVDIVKKHHKSYKNFFTPEECELIISVFERDKDTIPYGTEEETGYKGLTSAYSVYNWLYNKDIIPLNIPQRLFNLPEFNKWQYMITQCWGNALHVGEDLKNHYHGAELPHEFMRRYMFYNANIFLGGEYNLTWYEDTDYVENQIGDIHIFTCDLEHRVDKNVGEDTRYSMAIDIYPSAERITDYNQERYHMSKNERTEYRDTIPMRFYIARALFAIDYHNKIIMEESHAGERCASPPPATCKLWTLMHTRP